MGWGDSLTLLGGLLYAAHIVGVATLGRKVDLRARHRNPSSRPAAAIFWMVDLITPARGHEHTAGELGWWSCTCRLFPTSIGFLLQLVGQKFAPPADGASLILSLESVFGVLFSVLFYGEVVQPRVLVGFAVVVRGDLPVRIGPQVAASQGRAGGRGRGLTSAVPGTEKAGEPLFTALRPFPRDEKPSDGFFITLCPFI